MKRVSQNQLEAKAAELNRQIEFADDIAILKVEHGQEWYAALAPAAEGEAS